MEGNEKKKLFMSVRIPDTNDIVPGFGSKELVITCCASGIALIMGLFVFVVSGSLPVAIVSGVILVIFVILLIMRDSSNESLVDKIKYLIEYYRAQKQFMYQFYDSLKEQLERNEISDDDSK